MPPASTGPDAAADDQWEPFVERFWRDGHVTIPQLFSQRQIARAVADLERYSQEVLQSMPAKDRRWYLETDASHKGRKQLRKLDQPVFHRPVFRRLAEHPPLLALVRRLIGHGPWRLVFSQIFMKPPEVGGPKPTHQDNFYFGPDDQQALLTVWIALDDADPHNGCLYYGQASHRGSVLPHEAPEQEPFNLQVSEQQAATFSFRPAPVGRGGVSLHHGNTLHRSGNNRSDHPRRAVAFHYLAPHATLASPALPYDVSQFVQIVDPEQPDGPPSG